MYGKFFRALLGLGSFSAGAFGLLISDGVGSTSQEIFMNVFLFFMIIVGLVMMLPVFRAMFTNR